jgi:hypothetical protein
LSENDGWKIFRAVVGDAGDSAGAERKWISRVVELLTRVPLSALDGRGKDALRLYVAAKTAYPIEAEDGIAPAIKGILHVRAAVAEMTTQRRSRFVSALAGGRVEEAREAAQQVFVEMDEFAATVVRYAAGQVGIAEALGAVATRGGLKGEETFLTEFGGAFLLGAAFIDLQLDEALTVAAETCEKPEFAAAVLRLIVMVHCLGRTRANASITDAAVAMFAGFVSAPSLEDLAAVLAQADVGAALTFLEENLPEDRRRLIAADVEDSHAAYFDVGNAISELGLTTEHAAGLARLATVVLRLFAMRLPGFSRSSPEYLFLNVMSGTSEVRASDTRIEVRLARSPLSVVLQIAGAYCSYELPWRRGVEICLRAPSA